METYARRVQAFPFTTVTNVWQCTDPVGSKTLLHAVARRSRLLGQFCAAVADSAYIEAAGSERTRRVRLLLLSRWNGP